MPYKSDAQRRYFHWAAAHHKDGITPGMAHEWDEATKGKKLPEKVKKEKKAMEDAFIAGSEAALKQFGLEKEAAGFMDFFRGIGGNLKQMGQGLYGAGKAQYGMMTAPKSVPLDMVRARSQGLAQAGGAAKQLAGPAALLGGGLLAGKMLSGGNDEQQQNPYAMIR